MLNSVIKREISRQRPIVPFCLKLVANREFSTRGPETNGVEVKKSSDVINSSLEDNPFYQKYQDKIRRAQQNLMDTNAKHDLSPEEMRIRDNLKQLEESLDKSKSTSDQNDLKSPTPDVQKESNHNQSSSSSRPKRLEDVVHLDLLKKHEADEIKEIWSKHHSKIEDCIYSVIDSDVYNRIYDLATQYPLFLYPLPRSNKMSDDRENPENERVGYEFFLGQFNHHVFYFTPLILYQRYGENAPASLILNHFPELSSEKNLVLMNGEYDKKTISLMEAQCLANQINLFYASDDHKKKMLLHIFNRDPKSFNHQHLIQEFELSLVFRPPDIKA